MYGPSLIGFEADLTIDGVVEWRSVHGPQPGQHRTPPGASFPIRSIRNLLNYRGRLSPGSWINRFSPTLLKLEPEEGGCQNISNGPRE